MLVLYFTYWQEAFLSVDFDIILPYSKKPQREAEINSFILENRQNRKTVFAVDAEIR
jgi:hypothetical protein